MLFPVIVEASDLCNDLSFSLDPKSVSTVTRTWSIKVMIQNSFDIGPNLNVEQNIDFLQITQYKCNYENLAPSGCTEW